jgi:hypothetical protein
MPCLDGVHSASFAIRRIGAVYAGFVTRASLSHNVLQEILEAEQAERDAAGAVPSKVEWDFDA